MNALRQLDDSSMLNFDKIACVNSGELLVPVIVVDQAQLSANGLAAIRMLGYANRQDVDETRRTGLATFFSRSQGGLWTKGGTSGNTLEVISAYTDCDADVILFDVAARGPTCHTGASSCFEVPTIGE